MQICEGKGCGKVSTRVYVQGVVLTFPWCDSEKKTEEKRRYKDTYIHSRSNTDVC